MPKQKRGRPAVGAWPLLVDARRRRDHSQDEAAYFVRAQQDSWSNWERKVSAPRVEYWAALANYCGVTPEFLGADIAKNFVA